MMALIIKINIWNTCVIGVAWNRSPYKPIPLPKKDKSRFLSAIMKEDKRISMVTLEYKIDFSRLKVTALDNNRNNKENIVIVLVGFEPYVYAVTYPLLNDVLCA